MNEVFTAIFNLYNAGNDLKTALYVSDIYPGLYLDEVPQDLSATEYCVYGLVSDDQDYDFSDTTEDLLIYFNLFTETGQSRAGELLGYLKALFDDATLAVTGWRHLYMVRDFVGPNNNISVEPAIYGYHVEYEVLVEKLRS